MPFLSSRRLLSFALPLLLVGLLGFSPSFGEALPEAEAPEPALVFTVVASKEGEPDHSVHRITYTIAAKAMRIDAPGPEGNRSYLWNLSTRTVAALDNDKKTYHSDSLDKIMGFVDFSQLLGQYAGNNPKDRVIQGTTPRTVAGVTCTDRTILHRFKGRVVGMVNGDQKIVLCQATTFPGSDLYDSFQQALAKLAVKNAPKTASPLPGISPLSLETVRTTDYSKGFLVKILSALHLYDSSRIPARTREREVVESLAVMPVSSATFEIPVSYRKEASPGK
ncbi:MAG: hypothetical protein ACP5OP_04695 [Leptospirillia bacterium]